MDCRAPAAASHPPAWQLRGFRASVSAGCCKHKMRKGSLAGNFAKIALEIILSMWYKIRCVILWKSGSSTAAFSFFPRLNAKRGSSMFDASPKLDGIWIKLTHLESTFPGPLRSVDSEGLTWKLTQLESTLTRNRGVGPSITSSLFFDPSSLPHPLFSTSCELPSL